MSEARWRNCIYAPMDKTAKHCNKENEGKGRIDLQTKSYSHRANKGYFGCSNKCRFYKGVKE